MCIKLMSKIVPLKVMILNKYLCDHISVELLVYLLIYCIAMV